MMVFVRKLRLRFDRARFRRELEEELALHESLKVQEHKMAGLSAKDAAEQTCRDMGNVTLATEQATDVRTFLSLEHFMQDIQYALRLMRKNFGFTFVAILSLALGIGGNTAVFSVLNALLIEPPPFGEPQRLVRITEFFPKALLVHFRQQSRTMDIASASPGRETNVTGYGPAFRVTASPVSANLFSVLRAPAQVGRTFEPGEDQPGRDGVVILSHEFWMRQFGSDPAIVGRVINVGEIQRRIVGVMPAEFAFPSGRVNLWLPAVLDSRRPTEYWAGEFTPLVGRLRDGVSMERARSEIKSLSSSVWQMFPWPMPRNWNATATIIPLQTDLAGDARSRLLILLCVVGAVLAIACANVAGLLTARGDSRIKELAMRAALGAGQSRIVRQLLTESVVLAGAAGLVGLALGGASLQFLRAVISPELPGAARIEVDWNVAAYTAALSLLCGIAFGTTPAFRASRMAMIGAIKSGGQRSAGRGSSRLRSCLVAGEIALTLVLVIGATLLIRSLYSLSNVDPGFNATQILTMKITPDASFCQQRSACKAFYDRLVNEGRGVSGVVDAALANAVPLDGTAPTLAVDLEDHPKTAEFPAPMFWAGAISPDYLRLMGIRLLTGRMLTAADTVESEPVVLIDASTARKFWPGGNALGKQVKWVSEKRWRTVVGIVADVRQHNLANRTPAGIGGAMYMPYSQSIDGNGRIPFAMNLVVKTGTNSPEAVDELRRFAGGLNRNVPVGAAVRLDTLVGDSVSSFRSTAWLFLCFASVALVLATIGIYGLVSYSVRQRAYEIALRMAVGATGRSILHTILMRSLYLGLLGVSIGVVVALLAVRGLSALLFEVAPTDPLVYVSVSVFLLTVTLTASAIPAWRASRIDPVRVLRGE